MFLVWLSFLKYILALFIQLLIPHFRHTLHINIVGRKTLLGPGGALSEVLQFNMHFLHHTPILAMRRHVLLLKTYKIKMILNNLIMPDFMVNRALLERRGWQSSWEELCLRWPTAPSVCRRISLLEDWRPFPTSTTEMMLWRSGIISAGNDLLSYCTFLAKTYFVYNVKVIRFREI